MGMHEAYFEIHGKYAKTFPAHFPLLRLDRIYFKKLKIINSDILISTKEKAISDHLALMAEFDFYEE
jgi:endonuclease/exonuclease/phosphatase family metal-dependent hydrolase